MDVFYAKVGQTRLANVKDDDDDDGGGTDHDDTGTSPLYMLVGAKIT